MMRMMFCCSIGSDEDDDGDGDEEASVGDPSETAVSRDAAKALTSSSSSSSSSASPLDDCHDIPDPGLIEVSVACVCSIHGASVDGILTGCSPSNDRLHLSYDVCQELRGEIIRTVLCCIVY